MCLFAVLLAGFMSPALYGQQFYAGFDTGYGLKIPSGINNINYSDISSVNSAASFEKVNFSLGQGLYIGLNGGYKISDIASVELNVSYLNGAPVKAQYKATDTAGTYFTEMHYSMSARMIYLNPSFQLSMSPEKKFNPYVKFGIIYGFGKINEVIEGYHISGNYQEMNIVYRDGNALGFSSSLGIMHKISDLFDVFFEARYNALNYSPNKSVLTKFTKDGVDQLSSMTVYEKETVYVDSYSQNTSTPVDVNKPCETTMNLIPLHNYGFHIGLRFNL